MNTQRYPLSWPEGWKRLSNHQRKNGQFKHDGRSINVENACRRIKFELDKLSIKPDDTLISTNVQLRIDGLPRGDQHPSDPGVAVYWRKNQSAPMRCMAIDRYTSVADNLAAIAATLEAMRAIERHGGAEILDRAFTGFAALPASTDSLPWWTVLNMLRASATIETVDARYKDLARQANRDHGQNAEGVLYELNQARDAARKELSQ